MPPRNHRGYHGIAHDLRELIETGALRPGQRLPSENQLRLSYGCAQSTVRRALEQLKNDGLVTTRPGAGTFVRERRLYRRTFPARLVKTGGWGDGKSIWDTDDETRPVTVDSLTVETAAVPTRFAPVLGLSPSGLAVVRRRRYLVENVPVQLATSYYPAWLANRANGTSIRDADTGPGGVYAILTTLGYEPVEVREEIRSRMPTPDETAALELPPGTPIHHIVRTAYTQVGDPIEVADLILNADKYVLEYTARLT